MIILFCRCIHIEQKFQAKEEIRKKPMLEFTDTLLAENLPGFELMLEGFSCIKMLDKEGEEFNNPIPTPTHPQQFTWGEDILSQVGLFLKRQAFLQFR